MTTPSTGRGDLTWVVALAACFWGTSALLREPLAQVLDAGTIVMYEHLVLVLLLLPWLVPALRRWSEAPARVRVGAVVIGAGSSALATTLFTAAFRLGDPITPQILQKLQPLIAILLAAIILGERLRPRFWWFAVPALAGAWLMSFPEPFSVRIGDAAAALLALGAATLWGAGTVLGRLVDGHLGPRDTLALRFGFGLPAAAVIVAVTGAGWTMPMDRVPQLVLLALSPGSSGAGALLHRPAPHRGLAGHPGGADVPGDLCPGRRHPHGHDPDLEQVARGRDRGARSDGSDAARGTLRQEVRGPG